MSKLFNDITNKPTSNINTESPPNMKLQNINFEYSKKIDEYSEGDIICGKVGRYPWWPCMVTHDLNGKTYMKIDQKLLLLVIYFGPMKDYSYIPQNHILNIQSQSQFEQYVKEQIEKSRRKNVNKFKYHSRYKGYLKLSWIEAEKALEMEKEERIKKYFIDPGILGRKTKIRKRTTKLKVIEKKPKRKTSQPKEKDAIVYTFSQLTMPYETVRITSKCCRYCLETKNVLECLNQCGHNFHSKCLETLKREIKTKPDHLNKCIECSVDIVTCNHCFNPVDNVNAEQSVQCTLRSCNKWYHNFCVSKGTMHEMTKWTASNKFICPRHVCHKCELVSPFPKYRCNRLVACIMCSGTYHFGDWCIPAGSVELSPGEIICPRHLFGGMYSIGITLPAFVARLKSPLQQSIYGDQLNIISKRIVIKPNRISKPINVNWCFKCGEGGVLVCCETCPAAYHHRCISEKDLPENYYCVDCLAFCYRTYGEIVWAKHGSHRWWPGQILHLALVPDNINNLSHVHGQFCLQFFGTRDYGWTDQGKTFPYEEKDINSNKINSRSKITPAYRLAMKEAANGFNEREIAWRNCASDHVKSPSKYTKITVNKIVSKVRRRSSIPQCDCSPEDKLSDCRIGNNCINVELKYECHPDYCKIKNCSNQNFMKRNYPEQEIFWAGECGWALKTKVSIHKNQFVNEYVGEIIDSKETEIRTEWANKNNYTDFYFMVLENNRLIDARLYSNLSRFMNHSCNPNLYSEKWIVNGEPRIGLFALRDIAVDEELTFNYNLHTNSPAKIVCQCKSIRCSGLLGEPPKKVENSKRKILKSMVSKKFESDETESISTSCKSFDTEKSVENTCFRCTKAAVETKDIKCTVVGCPKIYHVQCLDLNIKKYKKDEWTCPWHFCDICGRVSSHFCMNCTSSYCGQHISDSNFEPVNCIFKTHVECKIKF